MAISTAELETMRDALLRARASGVLTVSHGGNTVTYRTSAEIAKDLADLEARIARASSTRPRVVRFSSSKGV